MNREMLQRKAEEIVDAMGGIATMTDDGKRLIERGIKESLIEVVNETVELCATAYIGEYDLKEMSGLEAKVRAIRQLKIAA